MATIIPGLQSWDAGSGRTTGPVPIFPYVGNRGTGRPLAIQGSTGPVPVGQGRLSLYNPFSDEGIEEEDQSKDKEKEELDGGGGASGFNFPQFNIGLPDLNFNPTAEQQAQFLLEAIQRSGLIIDPQVASREQGLSRFREAAGRQREEIKPRFDALSGAVANIFKNVVNQRYINDAVRRGFASSGGVSGTLTQNLADAGREEVGQRKDIENERNRLLDAIGGQVLGKETETSDALQALEGIRGKQTDVSLSDIRNRERTAFLQEQQGEFENALQNAIFQSGYSTDQANFLLNRFATGKEASIAEGRLELDERSAALRDAVARAGLVQDTNFNPTAVEQSLIDYREAQARALDREDADPTTTAMNWLKENGYL